MKFDSATRYTLARHGIRRSEAQEWVRLAQAYPTDADLQATLDLFPDRVPTVQELLKLRQSFPGTRPMALRWPE